MQFSATFKKYFANTSWLFAEKILRMGVSFFVGVWVARYLGPERLGLLSYAQSFVFLFSAFATLGLDGIVVRELVKTPEKFNTLLGTSFVLKLIGSAVTLLLLGSTLALTKADHETVSLMLIIGSATVFQSFNVIDFYFQSRVQSKYVVFAQAISMVVVNLLKVGLILNEAPLVWFSGVIVFEAFVTATGLISYYRKTGMKLFQWHFDRGIGKALFKDSWPLILSGVMVSLYMKADQVMITQILGDKANGLYSMAAKLSEITCIIPSVIVSTLYPSVIKDTLPIKNNRRLARLYSLLIAISIVVILATYTLSNKFITYILGHQFSQSITVLNYHIFGLIFISFGFLNNAVLNSLNYQKITFYSTLIGAIVNIILNFITIPILGISGAAIVTVFSHFIAAFLALSFFPKTRDLFFLISNSFFLTIKNKRY